MIVALTFAALAMNQSATFYSFKSPDIDGKVHNFSEYKGKVVIVVNVASACGNTPQYASLQSLYETHKKDGLVILGFPCNDFGKQEPGTADEIKAFCDSKYHVTFPIFQKIAVLGPEKDKLYAWLTSQTENRDISWNFEKFIIGRDGKIIKRFAPKLKPDSPEFLESVKEALSKK